MRFAASITTRTDIARAVEDLIRGVDGRVTPGMVDLAFLFATAHFEDDLEEIVARLRDVFPGAVFTGCTAEGVIGVDREVERAPGLTLLVASLPGVAVRPFHLTQDDVEIADTLDAWERLTGVSPESNPTFVAFLDPFAFDVLAYLDRVNELYPARPVVGGVASAARKPGENRLIHPDGVVRQGAVGVTLTGAFDVRTVVSQGCRPIARPFIITRGERNIVRELSGKPALEQLQSVLSTLPEQDGLLAQDALFLGRVIDEYKDRFTRGDFLIHNIIGADRNTGALGIAGLARVGATVQFHVRDAASADEDLHALLAPHAGQGVCGALLFGCNGRGSRMWPESGHDVGVLREVLGDIPVGGFFCGGELGPIGRRNFIHGFTASIALFTPRSQHESTETP